MTDKEDLDAIATVQYQLALLSQFSFTEEEIVKHSVDQVKRVDGNLVGRVLYDNQPVIMNSGRANIMGKIIGVPMPPVNPEDIIDVQSFD